MLSAHKGHHCQHRCDDFPSIAAIIATHQPLIVVELGTDEGGFSGWFSDLVAPWGGYVYTFDTRRKFQPTLLGDFPNLRYHEADVLSGIHPLVAALVSEPRALLYCDNGSKQREVELYAPFLREGSMLGVHDYNTEIKGAWVEPHVAALGYEPERHDLMEALRNEWYPEPMSRFWRRARVSERVTVPVAPPVAKPVPAPMAAKPETAIRASALPGVRPRLVTSPMTKPSVK